MLKCINPKQGDLLHAFELGMLSKVEREEFEEHLLECSYCFNQIDQHKSVMDILNSDQEIKNILMVEEIGEGSEDQNRTTEDSSRSSKKYFNSYIWPAIAAILIIVFVYQFNNQKEIQSDHTQLIKFTQLRSSDSAIIYLDQKGLAELEAPFTVDEGIDSVRIAVQTVDGVEVLHKDIAVVAGDRLVGIQVPLTKLDKGLHVLKIKSISPIIDSAGVQFTFRVK